MFVLVLSPTKIGELRKLRHHHPELWMRLRELDKRALEQFGNSALGQFKKGWTIEQLEQRFAAEDLQISVFDLLNKPIHP